MGNNYFDLANQVLATLQVIRAEASERLPLATAPAQQKGVELVREQRATELLRIVNQLGRLPILGSQGQTIQQGAGLLAQTAEAFGKLEPHLRSAHLVTEAFQTVGFARHRYAWPVLVQAANAMASWASEVADLWAGLDAKTSELKVRWRKLKKKQPPTKQPEEEFNWRFVQHTLARCPASDELLEAISWRLVQERDWLGQQQPEQPAAKAKAGGGRGGNNRNTDDRETVTKRLAEWHGYDANGDTLEDRITKLTPITGIALKKLAGVSGGLVSQWMASSFGSQRQYNQLCVRGNDTDKKKLDQIFASVMPRPKRSRTATAGELTFQAKTEAEEQFTAEEAFDLARAYATKQGEIISDDELWRRVRSLRVS